MGVRPFQQYFSHIGTMEGWKALYNEAPLGSRRISPPVGFEPATPWSEGGSANRSATRTLQTIQIQIHDSLCQYGQD